MQFSGDFYTFVPEAPVRAADKQVISFCFLYILLFETEPLLFSSTSKLFRIKRENYVPLYVLLSSVSYWGGYQLTGGWVQNYQDL